jgi:hypothetical protein
LAKICGFQRITPIVVPRALRSAVNKDDHRIFFLRVEIHRLDEIAVNLRIRRARPFEFFGYFANSKAVLALLKFTIASGSFAIDVR